MIGLFGDFYFVLLCLWKHRLRLLAETLGILSVLPASTFFCSGVLLLFLNASAAPELLFPLSELITMILRQESLFYDPSASLSIVFPVELLACFAWTGCQRQQLWVFISCALFTD